jgi:mannose-1-phosphate guanylyltransferase
VSASANITHVVLLPEEVDAMVSWQKSTKQYLDLFEGKSLLFEMTVARNAAPVSKVIVVGNIENCHLSAVNG